MRSVRLAILAAALIALGLLLVSGPGTRAGLWPWQVGLQLLRWAFYVGVGALVVALVALCIPRVRAGGAQTLALAVVACIAAAGLPLLQFAQAKSVPPIHDITTDAQDPPAFVALDAVRRASPNGTKYGGPEIAAAQAKAYPEIRAKTLAEPPQAAFARALEAARAMGWEIAATDPEQGRIEATDTTLWFGFKDDVVVRVRPEGGGSRIDVRSVSRVGRSDVGANARRIGKYLSRIT
jgi:hypothetical protein